eukprot:16344-Hanusia_phi.AAC.14
MEQEDMIPLGRPTPTVINRGWVVVVFQELSVLTSLAILAMVMQYSVFFFLMFVSPGIRVYGVPYCDSLHYISDKLAIDKGTASVMVISSVLSWVVLTGISCLHHPLLNRGITNLFALVGFTGVVCVVMYNNTSNKTFWHLIGTGMLSVTYVLAQLNFSVFAYRLPTVSLWTKRTALAFSCFSAVMLVVYLVVYNTDSCTSDVVIVEYVVYLLASLTNLIVYIDFTAMHTWTKLYRPRKPHQMALLVNGK